MGKWYVGATAKHAHKVFDLAEDYKVADCGDTDDGRKRAVEIVVSHNRHCDAPAFEAWIKRVRVQPNMNKKHSGGYMDMDTDWLWAAFEAGVAFASDAEAKP